MRPAYWLPWTILFVPSCWSGPGCDVSALLQCENDFECGLNEVCEEQIVDAICVEAEVCVNDADCPEGVTCDARPPTGPTHPFAGNTPNKKVCGCDPAICGVGGQGFGGTGGEGNFGQDGGAATGGTGGAGGDGAGGGAAGGIGGAS